MEKQVKQMNKNPYLPIVVPAYNEERNIIKSLQSIYAYLKDYDYNYDFNAPIMNANVDVETYLGLWADFLLYGVVGPNASVFQSFRFDADIPNWDLYLGAEARVGMKVEILGKTLVDYEATPIDFEEIIGNQNYGGG